MKTLIIGDIHGRSIWKDIIKLNDDVDSIVFMGDYFDSFDISGIDQLYNFNEIIQFKEDSDIDIITLIGNHDHHYMGAGETYSGYQTGMRWDIEDSLRRNRLHLQVAHQIGDVIFTHAGISPVWLDNNMANKWSKNNIVEDLNTLYEYQPTKFNFSHLGFDPYGNSIEQGPLWIRPSALMKSNKGDNGFKNNFRQVIGHTQQEDIFKSFQSSKKAMGEKYYNVDTLHSGGYAILEDGELTAHKIDI